MKTKSLTGPALPRALGPAFSRALAAALFAAALLLAGGAAAAQTADQTASEDDMFGAPETVTQAATTSKEAEGQSSFLKYDQVKVGGSFTGKLGFTSAWASPWDGGAALLDPASRYLTPDVEGRVTLVAKPLTDFGVNMDFRTSWPFTTSSTVPSGKANDPTTFFVDESKTSFSIPNISVWSLYSKFNWQNKVYFSFGKQPLSWGVSKGFFQPADDIFALSPTIDPTNTSAEREGPISLKTTVPLGVTNNLYFFAGLPTASSGSTQVDPADARLAIKAEYGFGNTELAGAAYYAYSDHPRALLMGTTGIGYWNFFGEAVLKYGSERYFLKEGTGTYIPILNSKSIGAAQQSGNFYFTGTAGGYYSDADNYITVALAYMFNGEGQDRVGALDALMFYASNPNQVDRIRVGTHYAFASISKTDILPDQLGSDKLSASCIVISNLSDQSGIVMPSLTWSFFDYLSLQVGGSFNFGAAGTEYIVYGVGGGMGASSKPGAALNLTLTVGTGSF